jgi:hypothetical protein
MAGWVALLLLLIPTLASADGNQAEPESGDEGERPGWAQRLYDYSGPPEYKVFEVAGHRFRVPYEYLTASSDQERGVFQIAPHWPTLDSPRTDKPQPRHREDFDTLQVTVSRFDNYELRQQIIQRRIAKVEAAIFDSDRDVDRAGDLVRVRGERIWITPDPIVLGTIEQRVQVVCDPEAPKDKIGNCRVSYMPFRGIEAQIKFDRQLFGVWREIVGEIHGMLTEYKEQ